MANDRPNYEVFTSPAGEAVYPWLTKADTRHDAKGVFKTDLSLPFELAQDFIAKLEKTRNDFIQTLPVNKQKSMTPVPVYREEFTRPDIPEGATDEEKQAIWDAWEGEPTGNVLFRFKMKARVEPKEGEAFDQKPTIVSADTGEKIDDAVYGGSILKVKGQIVPYTAPASNTVGVTLRMKAVQVIELVSGGGDSSFWTDFGSE